MTIEAAAAADVTTIAIAIGDVAGMTIVTSAHGDVAGMPNVISIEIMHPVVAVGMTMIGRVAGAIPTRVTNATPDHPAAAAVTMIRRSMPTSGRADVAVGMTTAMNVIPDRGVDVAAMMTATTIGREAGDGTTIGRRAAAWIGTDNTGDRGNTVPAFLTRIGQEQHGCAR